MRRDPGDELQVVHRLQLGELLAVPIPDLALGFQKRQPLQGQDRAEHVLSDPLGLGLGFGPDQAVDIEAGVRPGKNPLRPLGTQQLPADEKRQDLAGEDLGQARVVDPGDPMEDTRLVHPTLRHQKMEVDVKIDPVAEGLEDGDDSGLERVPGRHLEVSAQGLEGASAEIAQQAAVELEEDPQPLGDGEDDLAVRHVPEQRLPHPLPPLLDALGMTRRAESPRPAGEHHQPLLGAVRTPDAGEAAFRVAAVKIPLDHLLDDRPEIPVLPLEPALILRQEPVEMMEQHPVEDRPLRMPRTIHSRHGGRNASRTGPSSRPGPPLPEMTCRGRRERPDSGLQPSTGGVAPRQKKETPWSHRQGRQREDHGFRDRPLACGQGHDGGGRDRRDAGVHESQTGRRERDRPARGHLLPRSDSL